MEISFEYSNESAKKSIAHQMKETGRDFRGFALVHDNLEELCENAYPLEMHYDEKPKTADNHIAGVATLASVLDTGDGLIPVRITVKLYDNRIPKLHIVINGATAITAGRTRNAHVSAGGISVNKIKISDFFDIVKNSEEFTKRIPHVNLYTHDDKEASHAADNAGNPPLAINENASNGKLSREEGNVNREYSLI